MMVSITPASSPEKKEKIEPNHVSRYKNSYHSSSSKSEWGVESILTGMGIEEEYVDLFANKDIDTDTFMILEEDDLVEIGVQDAGVRARIMEGVRNCQLRKVSQNQLHKQFSAVDGTRILVSCANQLDTLCNLLRYTRQRLDRKPVINQYLYGQYSASEGARDIALALLSRIERLNVELQELQHMTRQEGEKQTVVTRLRGPRYHGASKLLTTTFIVFPILILLTAWKTKAITFRI